MFLIGFFNQGLKVNWRPDNNDNESAKADTLRYPGEGTRQLPAPWLNWQSKTDSTQTIIKQRKRG